LWNLVIFGENNLGLTLKPLTLILISALAASSLILVESASAQSLAKPSVPQFIVQFENSSVIIKVKEQQHPNNDQYGDNIGLSYTIRFHSNWEQDWKIIEQPFYKLANRLDNSDYHSIHSTQETGYTVFIYHLYNQHYIQTMEGNYSLGPNYRAYFQVQTNLGKVVELPLQMGGTQFVGQTSEWSDTQTLAMPEILTTPTPAGSFDYSPFVVPVALVVIGVILGAALTVHDLRKRKTT
jgi:hypothetical protein